MSVPCADRAAQAGCDRQAPAAPTQLFDAEELAADCLAAAQGDALLVEYTPLQIKQAVVGKGRATKTQVQKMVRVLVRLDDTPPSDHAADALAVAICHANFAKTDARYL